MVPTSFEGAIEFRPCVWSLQNAMLEKSVRRWCCDEVSRMGKYAVTRMSGVRLNADEEETVFEVMVRRALS